MVVLLPNGGDTGLYFLFWIPLQLEYLIGGKLIYLRVEREDEYQQMLDSYSEKEKDRNLVE